MHGRVPAFDGSFVFDFLGEGRGVEMGIILHKTK